MWNGFHKSLKTNTGLLGLKTTLGDFPQTLVNVWVGSHHSFMEQTALSEVGCSDVSQQPSVGPLQLTTLMVLICFS